MGCLKEPRGQLKDSKDKDSQGKDSPKDSKGKDSQAKLMAVKAQQDLLRRKEQPPTELHAGILRATLVELESVVELLMEEQDRRRARRRALDRRHGGKLEFSPILCPRMEHRRQVHRGRRRLTERVHGACHQRQDRRGGRRRLGLRRR